MAIEMVNLLGGSATPISWGELYTSLQQGVVDAAENNPPSLYTSHHYEVCKFYSLDEHTSIPDVLLVSTVLWDSLDDQSKKILQEAADASAQFQKKIWKEATLTAIKKMEEEGLKIIHPDKSAFFEKVKPMYRKLQNKKEGKLLRRIMEAE